MTTLQRAERHPLTTLQRAERYLLTALQRAELSSAACVVCSIRAFASCPCCVQYQSFHKLPVLCAVSELAELEPLELHRRGTSLSTVEVAAGSWTVGKMLGVHNRISDHGNMAGGLSRRRNSLSLANHDSSAIRSVLGGAQKLSVNIQAVAGPGESSSACFWLAKLGAPVFSS